MLHCSIDQAGRVANACLGANVFAVRGKASDIKKLADELIAAKGVKHGKLTITSTGKDLPG